MKLNPHCHSILKLQVRYESDIVLVRQKTRRVSELFSFDAQDQVRLATAVSELARNVFQSSLGGWIEFFFSFRDPQTLFVRAKESHAGVPSRPEWNEGLISAKKLMDFFEMQKSPETGMEITIGKSLHKRIRLKEEDLPILLDKLLFNSAPSPFEEVQNQNRDLLLTLEELRRSREELSDLNRELGETNRGVVALYAELDEKAKSLQKANEVKTSFLSHMTHEFRTPLSSIVSLTRLLIDRVDGDLTPEQEKQINYIRQSGESLLDLVSDLLDLAKVEAGKVSIHISSFNIEEILGGLRGMFRPLLGSGARIELKVEWDEEATEMETDQAKTSQILRNLVSNAIKFTEDGTITIAASLQEDLIHFKVSDTGIGIAPEFLGLIFEDFGQVNSKLHHKQKGTGLGLPLSRKFARLLGGDLWVESQLGRGSTFHVLLPKKYQGSLERVLISGVPSEPRSEWMQGNAMNPQMKIVLIDDDEPSRYVLRELLRSELEARFFEADGGLRGIQLVQEIRPDLIFLDLTMPEFNGFEVLDQIRRDQNLQRIPIIVNTAKKISPQEQTFLEKETTAVLTKERTDQRAAIRDLRRALQKVGFDSRRISAQM